METNSKDVQDNKNMSFKVDGQEFHTTESQLTPNQIEVVAGVDPATHFLKEIDGKEQVSYKDQMDVPIKMKHGMKFITIFSGPTTVS